MALPGHRRPRPLPPRSDGRTLLVSSWHDGQVFAYALADGRRLPERDIDAATAGNRNPIGVWSDGETLWVVDDLGRKLYAYAVRSLKRATSSSALALTLASPAAPQGGGPDLPVSIPDAALRAGIAAALGKSPGVPIGEGELAALRELDVRGAGVGDLTGLGRAVNLVALDIGFNAVADLRPLTRLPDLRKLNLDGLTADLWELGGLVALTRLSLRSSGIEDLSALAGLTELRTLDIGNNRIGDLGPLAGLTWLVSLRADRNLVEDLVPLAALKSLVVLDLGRNRVADLGELARLESVRRLLLQGNIVTDLSPLGGLGQLVMLNARDNAVRDAWPLAGLPVLLWLDLRDNPLADDMLPGELGGEPALRQEAGLGSAPRWIGRPPPARDTRGPGRSPAR